MNDRNSNNKESGMNAWRLLTKHAVSTSLLVILLSLAFHALAEVEIEDCESQRKERMPYSAECGMLRVYEDNRGSQGRQIELHYVRVPSIKDTDKPAIFFFAGGPGQASSMLVQQMTRQLNGALKDHDFVFVDQRGTGLSEPLDCDIDLRPLTNKPIEEIEKLVTAHHKTCVENYEADLRFYSTPFAVRDYEAIRRALGYEKIIVWGGSYGTRVALEYLRAFPDALAGAILDSVAPVSIQLPYWTTFDASAALAKIFTHCESDPVCQRAFPDLKSHWLETLNTLAASPKTLSLSHPRSLEAIDVRISDITLSLWVRGALYVRPFGGILPSAIDAATQGNYVPLSSMASLFEDGMEQGMWEGMQMAVLCAEDISRPPPQVDMSERLIRGPANEATVERCQLYPKSDVPEEYFAPVRSTVPTLLLAGELDPVTPPRWAESVAASLSQSKVLSVAGAHHIVTGEGCARHIIEDFIAAPESVSTLETDCTDLIQPPHFFIDAAGPQMHITAEGEAK